MNEWAHRECGMTRQALQGIGEGIKKEPEGCLLLTSFRLIFLRWRLPTSHLRSTIGVTGLTSLFGMGRGGSPVL